MNNKGCIVLACALAGAGGWRGAAADDLKFYGLIDLGLNLENDGSGQGTVTRISSGGQTSSRIGVRGSETLDGTLVASFVLESGVLADTGAIDQGGVLFGRQAWVALSGAAGTLKAGRKYTVSAEVLDSFDPFHINTAGDASRLFNVSGKRVNNVVSYTTPDVRGLSVQLTWGFGEQPGSLRAGRQLGAAASYLRGPLSLAVAVVEQNTVTPALDTRTTMAGGVYDFGVLRLHAGAGWNTDSAGLDTRDALLGVGVPFGASVFSTDYIRKWDRARAHADAGQFALGYSYALSKRTNFYSSFSATHNGTASKYNALRNGDTDRLFNLGIRHTF